MYALPPPSYAPLQPAVPAAGVDYAEYAPAAGLRALIYCYWELTAPTPAPAPLTYRVVADGCIDLFFDLDQPADGTLMGFTDRFSLFCLQPPFRYAGVRFLPGGFATLFGLPAAALSHQTAPLAAVLPALGPELTDLVAAAPTTAARTAAFDAFFLPRLGRLALAPDPRLRAALDRILRSHGTLRVQTDLDVGLSARQLRRVFEHHVGATPKAFSNVVRFQHLLRAVLSTSPPEKNLFFDAGYYDQAHFIREFRARYGTTPGQALGR